MKLATRALACGVCVRVGGCGCRDVRGEVGGGEKCGSEDVLVAMCNFSSFAHACTRVTRSFNLQVTQLFVIPLIVRVRTHLCARVMVNDARAGTKLSAPRDITAVT